jgi:hypothetical protein
MQQVTIYNHLTGEVATAEFGQAQDTVRISRGEWRFEKPLPPGWDKEIPRYRAQIDLLPPLKDGWRQERPFSVMGDGNRWQYMELGRECIRAGEELSTTAWPHESMIGLNDAGRVVLEHFRTRQKSRLRLSPWENGRVALDDGTSFEKGSPPKHEPTAPTLRREPSARSPRLREGARPRVA